MSDATKDVLHLLALVVVGFAVGIMWGTRHTDLRWSEWRGCVASGATVEWCERTYHPPTPTGADREQ